MKKLKELRKKLDEELQFKVDVEGMPPTFMSGKSSAEILAKLRKIVKQPSLIKGVERQTDVEVKKAYRNKAQGRGMDEAVDPSDTGGDEEVSMGTGQIKAMRHYLDGIEQRIKSDGDMEEWFQNKLTKANDYLKTLYGYGKGKTDESTQPEWGTDASTKKAKQITPNESVKSADKKPEKYVDQNGKTKVRMVPVDQQIVKNEGTAQIRMNRALKKHGVGKNDEFYKSKMDAETRKKYEPKKVERKPVSVEPPKNKPFSWIKTK
jgi:hypothetical protein